MSITKHMNLEIMKQAAKMVGKTKDVKGPFGFNLYAKLAVVAQLYVDEGHAKQLTELEEWKAYYIDYYQNNPDIMDEV